MNDSLERPYVFLLLVYLVSIFPTVVAQKSLRDKVNIWSFLVH